MKIVVTGTRGIPDIQGGVETHCQQLYPRIAAMGHDVTVIRRKPYLTPDNSARSFQGVRLKDIYAPSSKSFEAIVHTFLAVLETRRMNPDVLHIHAIGPSLMVPFARLLGMKVVMTNHGPDYDRKKWGRIAKTILRLGERLGSCYSSKVIVISEVIRDIVATKYNRTDTALIPNGVNKPVRSGSTDYIESLGLRPGRYALGLGRFVREKGFDDLIEAFGRAAPDGYKLVIAGDADHDDAYSMSLKEKASRAGVVLSGFIHGEKLNQIMSHAGLYVMASYHEGLPISLLEAMSYELPAIVSDIPANRLSCLDKSQFYPVGDIDALAAKIAEQCFNGPQRVTYDLSAYDWDSIARQTEQLYRSITDPDN